MNRTLRFLPYIFTLLLLVLPTLASAAKDYTVTPKVIDVTAEARDIINKTITITNNHNSIVNVFPTVNEIALDEGGDIVEFKGPTQVDGTSSITRWLEIPRSQQSIMPGETKEINLTIRMHPQVQPGVYHAYLGFGEGLNSIEAAKQAERNQAPGIVVTVRIEDKKVEFVDLGGFYVDKYVTSNDNQAVSYTLKNPGDTTVMPTGEIIIYDGSGKEEFSIEANPDFISLAPGEEIRIERQLPINGLFGKQKAFLNVRYGSNLSASVYDTVFFYVLPWQKILMIFGIIVVFTIILTLYLHHRYEMGHHHDEDEDGVHALHVHVVEGHSDEQEHDINLKAKNTDTQ